MVVYSVEKEVVDLIRSKNFLSGDVNDTVIQDYCFIRDEEQAYTLAFTQLEKIPFSSPFSQNVTIWSELRSELIAELPNQDRYYKLASLLSRMFFAYVPIEWHSIEAEVTTDFVLVVAASESGMHPTFTNLLLEAYKSGLWPCGWIGVFPEGRMCVSVPLVREEMMPAERKRVLYMQSKARKEIEMDPPTPDNAVRSDSAKHCR